MIHWCGPSTRERLANHEVGNLITDAGLMRKYNRTVLAQLRFSFLMQPSPDRNYFSVGETTGVVRSTHKIDRERICPRQDDCVIKFDVAIKPIQFFQIIKVKIEIVDINDNSPIFSEKKLYHQMSEAAEIGSGFVVPAATDMDSNNNGVARYEIHPFEGHFDLQIRRTVDSETDLRLVLRSKLDREIEDQYLITVYAIDNGDPPKTGSIDIDITILDANDNVPEFENSSYQITVLETVPVGSILLKVKATDNDAGLNGIVIYDFSKHTAHEYGHLFGIRNDTGKIILLQNLDFETGSIHLLSVTANDKGPDSLPSHTSVVIHVEDVNDNVPQIKINTLTGDGSSAVSENSEVGIFVAHVSVVDADSRENGRCACALDSNHFQLQKLYSIEFKIVTAVRFDRERKDIYTVSVTCWDHGVVPHTAVVAIPIQIIDENDNAPRFPVETLSVAIYENQEIGTEITRIEATDADAGNNGKISYKLSDDVEGLFRIEEFTGLLFSTTVFDREKTQEIIFEIMAQDSGHPPQSAFIQVRLTILDLDDEKPKFPISRYSFAVSENLPSGAAVGKVTAIDEDSPPFDRFSYSIDQRSDSGFLFDVDFSTGHLTTRHVLDRENCPVHCLTILAIPDDDVAYSATVSVTIYVSDTNDHRPRFRYPLQNETLTISSMTPKGHDIAQIKAIDLDSGSNANLTYTISAGNEDGKLHLEPQTGALKTNSDLKSVEYEEMFLMINVKDAGDPQHSSGAELRLIISSEVPFVAVKQQLPGILANDSVAVILAVTLAAILMAITVISVVILFLRNEDRRSRSNGMKDTQVKDPALQMIVNGSSTGTGQFVVSSVTRTDEQTRSNGYAATGNGRYIPPICQSANGHGNINNSLAVSKQVTCENKFQNKTIT